MTRKSSSALRLTLALLVGLGAGALWRAGGARVDHQRDEHADDPAGAGAMSGMDMRDMQMPAMEMGGMTSTAEGWSYAINLANDTCPVMGGETDGEVYTHWKGLRVQFCCEGCEEGFLTDPEGALSEFDVDPSAALRAIASLRSAQGEERTRLLEELASRYHVVEVQEGHDE